MFEISWSEILILGIVTLIFVGPKELPVFLRTLGKYAGSIKRQASEFRSQFDAAMREAELDSMRREVEAMQTSINTEVMRAKSSIDDAGRGNDAPIAPAAVTPAPHPAADLPAPPMPAPPRGET